MNSSKRNPAPAKVAKPPFTQGQAAKILRVSREWLCKCLKDKSKNPRLVELYHELIATKPTTPPPTHEKD